MCCASPCSCRSQAPKWSLFFPLSPTPGQSEPVKTDQDEIRLMRLSAAHEKLKKESPEYRRGLVGDPDRGYISSPQVDHTADGRPTTSSTPFTGC